MMAKEQPSLVDLLHLLESSDLHELDEIKEILNNNLSQDRGSLLLNSLVDYYLESSSAQALHILSSVREPHDKHLFDKMNECMAKPACRLATLTLLGHVIRKQPSWIHKISRSPVLPSLLKCLKTDGDAVVLITGVLVLITLLPMIPQAGKQHLYEFFDIFGRLAAWNMKNPGHIPEVYLIHLHASVYALFHRLYGMYPCNFVSYLRSHYSMKENMETFEEVVKPMLEHVRIHPELVTGTKDHELDPTRWKRFEIHDIVIECAKVSLDPKEASCEEGYSTMPEHFSTHVQHRQADPTASPFTDLQSSFGSSSSTPFSTPLLALSQLSGTQPPYRSPQTSRRLPEPSQELFWSPSSVCGMATPPSSRGISPTSTPSELSHSASHLPGRVQSTLAGGKGTPSCNTPATSSPPPLISDEFEHISLPPRAASPTRKNGKADSWKPGLTRQENIRDSEKGTSDEANNLGGESENLKTVTLNELPEFIKELELEQDQRKLEEREEDAFTEELYEITAAKRESPTLRGGFDSPFYRTTETLTGNQKKPVAHPAPMAASSCGQNTNSTPDKQAGQPVGGQEPCFFKPVFTPIEGPLQEPFRSHSPPAADEGNNQGKYSLFTPSPCKAQAAPYEPLFDLALPKAAALFVGRRTAEAVRRAGAERLVEEEEEEEGEASTSPLEVLDRLIQQGSDMHVKELKRLPLPSKSADWTHFGGTAPVDELHTLRSQLLLLHTQLLYERYKREQHATRNRRLLRRIINATALEEQNAAMKDQLSLQEVDMQSLKDSLQDEQLRYQQQREEHEMMVSRLHSQTKQLQQGRDEYYAKSQELQSKLVECQKEMGMLRAELQKANKKVCNKGHLLNLLSQKLTSSETVQQQLEFLNKRLLLLGEANELYAEELRHSNPDNTKEVEMMQASHKKELDKMKQSAVQQSQRLEAAQKRIAELESHLAKKEHLLLEQKKYLEDVKTQAKGQLQAAQSRYQAQRQITQVLEKEMLELYSWLEREGVPQKPGAASCSTGAGGGETEACMPTDSRTDGSAAVSMKPGVPDGTASGQANSPKASSSTLSHGQQQQLPQASLTAGSGGGSVNGSRHPPIVLEPSPSHSSSSSSVGDIPITVGSYPSAKSFLGMRARELFRNKSESQCDDDDGPRLASLAQSLKTDQCVEPSAAEGVGQGQDQGRGLPAKEEQTAGQQRAHHRERQRQQQLRIMDYNEAHHEHS
ncbi:hamartin-like [Acipenser ruthenus]|uniref:hamartin-like n=1 Tax=Acipenser ruthenus TaxID=7906 RepID=UPI0027416C75|nr:hamartin-like [Acipenser ruthenus]XP_058842790.1 hamartin-like [Acipenser ruthenus]